MICSIRYHEVYTYIQSAIAGQKVNLTGIHVGWYNGTRFDLTKLDEIELVEVSDAKKVLMIKDELIDLYDNKSYTSGSTITLIDTSTTHGQDTQISSMTDITIELEQQGDFYYRLVFENASPTSSNGWLGRIKTITYYS
ncbi:hypothetical protein BN85300430 [Paracholeplasma brassicae]|uniref:Uncharacterized protein n=1 Tax=Acholeplasma brassicae TaxID=61635 RepID=U4KSJ3_9MOLU|nr:hypothetical protein [Paracholeplasma brassicae]CCV65064.1 hypothetical protein BN85300430 [Paracholeplasma brassicae]